MILSLRNVQKHFAKTHAVENISLDVEKGELIALIGPSGCGKSTLLRCINGLEFLTSGEIEVGGVQLRSPIEIGEKEFAKRTQKLRQKVGMVFQSFNLFPHLTLLENLTKAPQVVLGKNRTEAEQKARELLEKVGMGHKAESYPHELSGGQQQRGAIARALAMAPDIMLYDEPTSALDPELVKEVLRVMKQLDQEGMTQIIVTHEMRFAREAADRVVYIEHGEIVEIGRPEEIFVNPKHQSTRRFLEHFL